VRFLRALHEHGVLGINARNAHYTLRWNARRLYPNVDDKLTTKRLCEHAGIPTPKLLAMARHHFELRALGRAIESLHDFVLKPSRGAMGNGILVVRGRDGDRFAGPGHRPLGVRDLLYHAAGIISGLYALAGQPDVAMLEERLEVHPDLAAIAVDGVPDVRVIVYRGIPVMAMTRLPTRRSGGRANLHQGAVAAGIDLVTGRTTHAILHSHPIRVHPDSGESLLGRPVPGFAGLVDTAVRASDESGLGYVGADLVVDARLGPVILELNARPGLMIQLANHAGLLPRLRAVDRTWKSDRPLEERVDLARAIARATASEAPR
jgi:alpha-L-glutamate ligase-like protein